jgi:hypothetical protein
MWKPIDKCHLENYGWTITKSHDPKSLYPYGLWQGNVNKGFYETADEAKAKYEELTK